MDKYPGKSIKEIDDLHFATRFKYKKKVSDEERRIKLTEKEAKQNKGNSDEYSIGDKL